MSDYDPTHWVNGETALTDTRLNKIEGALDGAVDLANDAKSIASNALQYAHDAASQTGAAGPVGPPGPPGNAGQNGQSFHPRGPWQPNTDYERLDVYTHDGRAYLSYADFTSPATWVEMDSGAPVNNDGSRPRVDLISDRGASGPAGPAGYELQVSGTTTLNPGEDASVELSPRQDGQGGSLAFYIPRGAPGPAGYDLSIGTVAIGDTAEASIDEDADGNHFLNLIFPSTVEAGGGGGADLSQLYAFTVADLNDRENDLRGIKVSAQGSNQFATQLGSRLYAQQGQSAYLFLTSLFFTPNADYSAGQPTIEILPSLYGMNSDPLPAGLTLTSNGSINGVPTANTFDKYNKHTQHAVKVTYIKTGGSTITVQGIVTITVFPAS